METRLAWQSHNREFSNNSPTHVQESWIIHQNERKQSPPTTTIHVRAFIFNGINKQVLLCSARTADTIPPILRILFSCYCVWVCFCLLPTTQIIVKLSLAGRHCYLGTLASDLVCSSLSVLCTAVVLSVALPVVIRQWLHPVIFLQSILDWTTISHSLIVWPCFFSL